MEEAAHRELNSCQSFLGRTLIQGLYICEDSQTTASRSATTGGCPPMLKLFMIGNQNQKSNSRVFPGFPWFRRRFYLVFPWFSLGFALVFLWFKNSRKPEKD